MRYEWRLEPLRSGKPLHIVWDPETGEIDGEGASVVRELLTNYMEHGLVSIHPWPSSIEVTDPFHNMTELAAVLGNDWKLAPELIAAYPKIDPGPTTQPGFPDMVY